MAVASTSGICDEVAGCADCVDAEGAESFGPLQAAAAANASARNVFFIVSLSERQAFAWNQTNVLI
jgi:hypothetical protein